MTDTRAFPKDELNAAGLNRQFVFDLAALPTDILDTLGEHQGFRQLLLLGHGGRRLWECVQKAGLGGAHPIDDYTVRCVENWLASHLPGKPWRILYPGPQPVGLQALGRLAGWHHASPFMVGIDAGWGSWFAYRALVLVDADLPLSLPVDHGHPCTSCAEQACIAACPASAAHPDHFRLDRCLGFRGNDNSACRDTCLSRLACPVGAEHRYSTEQMRHSYAQSLRLPTEAGLSQDHH